MKRLYLLEDIDVKNGGMPYDMTHSMIILAENEAEARTLANEEIHTDNQDIWMDSNLSSCEVIEDMETSRIIHIRDWSA